MDLCNLIQETMARADIGPKDQPAVDRFAKLLVTALADEVDMLVASHESDGYQHSASATGHEISEMLRSVCH